MLPPSFQRVRPSEQPLARLEENVAQVLDTLREQVLRQGLSYGEHWRGQVKEVSVTLPLSASVPVGLSADFPGAVDYLQVLDALNSSGRHFAGAVVEWTSGTTGRFRNVQLHSVSGLAPGAYILRLLVAST